ncbi:hypothetical protein WS90_11560 [Burkholderia cepacia]|uniref:Uncharacterized protein n=1 Tax=Burkholderia cepacia TaxID=292 RepID=A0A103ZR57_BURCE|nr:hypothetical protein WS90_11560 [Burkholderia cepacia]
MSGQTTQHRVASMQLVERDELVGLVPLVHAAGPAHHGRNAGLPEQPASVPNATVPNASEPLSIASRRAASLSGAVASPGYAPSGCNRMSVSGCTARIFGNSSDSA